VRSQSFVAFSQAITPGNEIHKEPEEQFVNYLACLSRNMSLLFAFLVPTFGNPSERYTVVIRLGGEYPCQNTQIAI